MQNATTKARTTFCSSPPLLGLSPVGDVPSAVENVLAAYSVTTVAPHEYFDQTGLHRPMRMRCGRFRFQALKHRMATGSASRTVHRSGPGLPVIGGGREDDGRVELGVV